MTSKVRITVIVENTAQGAGMLAEHGLAYWIEWNGQRVLFDTGQGKVLESNAEQLGIPFRKTDAVVLSHGHYDHTGGLAEVLNSDRPIAVYLHPTALATRFVRNKDGSGREIGIPLASKQALRQRVQELVWTEGPTVTFDGLMVTGAPFRLTDFEDPGGPFFLDPGCQTPDPILDDQAMFFEAKEGTVVLLGCAHAGVINTLRYVRALTGQKPIHAVLGGMHLLEASSQRIERTIEQFRELDIVRLGPAHCTGMTATAALWSAFPDRCLACNVGTVFEFEVD